MSEYIVEVGGQMTDAVYENQREEIVRCRDCKHFLADELGEVCGLFDFEIVDGKMREGFCAWGTRRDGE